MNKFKKGILTFGGLVAVAAPIATSIAATNTTTKTPEQIKEEEFQKKKAEHGKDNVKGDTRDHFIFDNAKYPWIDQDKDGILTKEDVIFTVKDAMTKEQARLGETTKNPKWATTLAEHVNGNNLTIEDLVVLKNVSFPKNIHTLGKAEAGPSPLDSDTTDAKHSIIPGWRIIGGFKIPINIKIINPYALYWQDFIFYKKDYVEIQNETLLMFVNGIEIYKPDNPLHKKAGDDSVDQGTQLALKIIPKPIIIKAKVDSIWKIIAISVSITLGVVLLGSSMYWFDRDKTK